MVSIFHRIKKNGTAGCQSFEATDFLLRRRKFDTTSHLILWQIGVIGHFTYNRAWDNSPGLTVLADYLKKYYGLNHKVFVYEAVEYSIVNPLFNIFDPKTQADKAFVDTGSTLYSPPKASSTAPIDQNMAKKLGSQASKGSFFCKETLSFYI